MPKFEKDYNETDYQLIGSQVDAEFGLPGSYDYVRLIVYPTESITNIVRLEDNSPAVFYSTLETLPFNINVTPFFSGNLDTIEERVLGNTNLVINGNFRSGLQYWEDHSTDPYDIAEIDPASQALNLFSDGLIPEGDNPPSFCIFCTNSTTNPINLKAGVKYRVQFEFSTEMTEDVYPTVSLKGTCGGANLIQSFTVENGVNTAIFVADGDYPNAVFQINNSVGEEINFLIDNIVVEEYTNVDLFNDFKTYYNDVDNSIYVKPNEIFNQYGLPEGNYKVQLDFLNQVKPSPNAHYEFIIKEISTSRKEVRVKLISQDIGKDDPIISELTNQFNDGTGGYAFKHFLNFGNGEHIPIMNYEFDDKTDGRFNQSIILKLYEPLSGIVPALSTITIEKEILTTQVEEVYYFSDVADVFFGDGLNPDPQENWINPDGENTFENYNELSSSIQNITLQNQISSSDYSYPNVKVNYNEFENHTHFGSAKIKLENFKSKVQKIQNYYGEISESLGTPNAINPFRDSGSVVQIRETLFDKINDEINSFTPYEKFLYFDGQSNSTASAPGVGKNYADSTPVTQQTDKGEAITLNQHDGFEVIYKFSDKRLDGLEGAIESDYVDLFTDKYKVHDKPFFNYSGSIYLSYLMKSMVTDIKGPLNNHNGQQIEGEPLPQGAFHSTDILNNSPTGSEYRRFIFKVSQSYWIPTGDDSGIGYDIDNIETWTAASNEYEILSGSVKTGSNQIFDSSGVYPLTVITESGNPLIGACMPAGELFRINYTSGSFAGEGDDGIIDDGFLSASYIADVKVSFNNPSEAQPFSQLYHTSSTAWVDWFNNAVTQSEQFDTDNINSFENNLPLYIQESSDYGDFKDFLSLQGEQYDIIKNHIDSLGTLHERGYKEDNSPPESTYPLLLDNMGWQAINPFTGDLSETLGQALSSVTSIDKIKNDTWRKTLNNLLYIYKTKGTQNSVTALLNVYGYPSEVLKIQEFGGSTEEQNQIVLTNNPPTSTGVDIDLLRSSGSIGFTERKQKLYRYMLQNKPERTIRTKWWMDDANPNTIEFVYKHKKTTNTQTILESSGSGAETLWDLRLVPSTDGISSSFEFRLNNSETGSSAIASNAVSMSTSYSKLAAGQLWNVMLQRMSSSISGSGTNEYRLHVSLQDKNRIKLYNYVTMSVSGGSSVDSNYRANENWPHTGSFRGLDTITSSNLYIGETMSGSLAEIKAWSTPLSISRFRQHTLNKFSSVGNSISSHREELVYHFKLAENYNSSSISSSTQNMFLIDSAPTTTYKDYSFQISGSLISGSSALYGFDYVNVIKFGLQDNASSKAIDKHIIVNPKVKVRGNLSPEISPIKPLNVDDGNRPSIVISKRLEMNRSPQDRINDYILNNMDTFNFEKYYGNPQAMYSSSYSEFDDLRKEFFDSHPIQYNSNDFIRAMENMFNHSVIEAIKSVVPASSTFSDRNSNMGVIIKPTILEKQKYEREKHSVEANPNLFTGSIEITKNTDYKSGFSSVGSIELPKSGSTSVTDLIVETGSVVYPYSGSIMVSQSYSITGSEIIMPYSGSIMVSQSYSITGSSIEYPKSGSIMVSQSYSISGSKVEYPYSGSITISDTGSSNSNIRLTGSKIIFPTSGSIDYASRANKSFVNIHDSWGKGHVTGSDTHFLNMASKITSSITTGSYTFNFNNSGSHGMKVTITSFDTGSNLLTKTYVIATASAVGDTSITTNGALSSDSSSVHFVTGSPGTNSGSLLVNLLAAITSSNGHGPDKFNLFKYPNLLGHNVLTASGKLELTQSGFGPKGNTPIIFSNDFSSSTDQDLISSSFDGGSIIPGYFNVGHIETRYVFRAIGDVEYYSSSKDSGSNHSDDFSNQSRIYNRELLDDGVYKNSTYESLMGGTVGNQTGRALGKTKYFLTSSTGVITLPSNHIAKFSYPFKAKMYEGTQNITNTGSNIYHRNSDDVSSASFYSVKVTGGENEIKVVNNKGKLGGSGRIIYD
tara:strand:- start:3612 stop:9554 length:5943 start_codon:yes stop_codon:yes gene_type:complete